MKADKILYSDFIFTGCSEATISGGIAIQENRILFVGGKDEIKQFETAKTQVFDFQDNMITPGFCEGHAHFFSGAIAGSQYCCNELLQAISEQDCVERMIRFRREHPGLSKYVGNGWLTINWNNAPLPTKRSLDEAFPDVPVYMIAADCHSVWVNSRALEDFMTDEVSPDILRFENGELTGVFKELSANDLICESFRIPPENSAMLQKNLLVELNKAGITSLGELSGGIFVKSPAIYDELDEMEQKGTLTVRMYLYSGILDKKPEEVLPYIKEMDRRFHSRLLSSKGFKIFADGVSATHTAAMLDSYKDRPDIKGSLCFAEKDILEAVVMANLAGYPVRIHACGDYAVRVALNAFEEAKRQGADKNLRNAVEHIDIMNEKDISRFAKLKVIASVQPCHVPQDGGEKIIRNGPESCRYEWPFRSLSESGAMIAFGTDYPVESFHPLKNIYMAVTRCDLNGNCTCANPQEKVTVPFAIKAYTCGGAFLHGMEAELGTIEEGKLADITVLDRNLLKIPLEEIKETQVLMTIMDGKIVYQR